MMTPSFLDSIDSQLDWQREVYKDLHRNPEVSLDEHKTADRVGRTPGLGLEVSPHPATGLVAVIENGTGPTVLRADIDALPSPRTPASTSRPRSTVSCTPVVTICMPRLLGAVRLLKRTKMPGQARISRSSNRQRRTLPEQRR